MAEWNASEYNRQSSLQAALAEEQLGRLTLEGSERVLDVGCGDGKITAEIAARVPRGSVLGVDPSENMIAFAARHFGPATHPNLRFEVADVGKSAAIFDEKKLRWLNGRFMREMPLDEYTVAVARHLHREPDERLRDACAITQDKAQTLEEVWPLIRFLYEPPVDDEKAWAKVMKEGTGEMLDAAAEVLGALEPFTPDAIEGALAPLLDRFDVKPGRLYQPLRVAITGTSVSPGIFESLATLGREQTVSRLRDASRRLSDAA